MPFSSRRRPQGLAWILAAMALAVLPVAGVFTTTRVFFLRDLSWYFWPRHRWLRETWASRDWPWWDSYIGGGQSAVNDALNQFFLVPITALRLLAPELVGFNLWVALPFPLAAAGAWLWLRRSVSSPAAFVGAMLYALSGPMLSTGNFPNLSWSAAFIPWVLWAAQRLEVAGGWRPIALLGAFVALQGVSGEAVTFAATGALCLGCALVSPLTPAPWRVRFVRAGRVVAGLATGVLLAAVQLLPLGVAGANSSRNQRLAEHFWSLHPLALIETIQPSFFGQALYASPSVFPWIPLLNSHREPLFYSLYIGIGAIGLALVHARLDNLNRWRMFWWGVAAASVTCALGHYTPVYGWLQEMLPFLRSFRYAVKYVLFASLAIAALGAAGAEALRRHARGEAALGQPTVALTFLLALGSASLLIALANTFAFESVLGWYTRFSAAFNLPEPIDAGRWLAGPTTWLWLRLGILGLVSGMLIVAAAQAGRAGRLAALLLCTIPVADLLVVNQDLNPTASPDYVHAPPVWLSAVRQDPESRVYIGGLMPIVSTGALTFVDGPASTKAPVDRPFAEAHALMGNQYLMMPASWRVRQIISQDLPELWPKEYRAMLVQVMRRPLEDRIRFLSRVGVRYCVLPGPPYQGARLVRSLEPLFTGFDLYECGPEARRVYVADKALVRPDLTQQMHLMVDEAHDPFETVLLEREPAAAFGTPGPGTAAARAAILTERPSELVIRAEVQAGGGYLTLLDSYDPDWRVTVDGAQAALLRANVLFRAVRLAPGNHEVRFTYRPMAFYTGLAVSALASLGLLIGVVRDRRIARAQVERPVTPTEAERAAGFTLIELLIVIGVISILFAIAIPWLLNARMAANEASVISALGAINDAQALYKEVCGKGRYSATLPGLAEPVPSTGDSFLSPDLAAADVTLKAGYQIAMTAETGNAPVKGCNEADTTAAYAVTADPLQPGNSGRRYFATNTSRVIYEHLETLVGSMPASGPPPAGTELRQ